MTSIEAKNEIINNLDIVKSIIKEEIDNKSSVNYHNWLTILEDSIINSINGLKRICFDNGELYLFEKMKEDILGYWNSIKNNTYSILKEEKLC